MLIIQLHSTASTNATLMAMADKPFFPNNSTLLTFRQTRGKGSGSNLWISQDFKNLTFSLYRNVAVYDPNQQFGIGMVASLALFQALKKYSLPGLYVKWPNDLVANHQKLAGIRIDTKLTQKVIKKYVVGIGLNVNQQTFGDVPNAVSMINLIGGTTDLFVLFEEITNILIKNLENMEDNYGRLKTKYEQHLYLKDREANFKSSKGDFFIGTITGVDWQGRLNVKRGNRILCYKTKEIELLGPT